jgi:methyl-accepting chemotaxis protein
MENIKWISKDKKLTDKFWLNSLRLKISAITLSILAWVWIANQLESDKIIGDWAYESTLKTQQGNLKALMWTLKEYWSEFKLELDKDNNYVLMVWNYPLTWDKKIVDEFPYSENTAIYAKNSNGGFEIVSTDIKGKDWKRITGELFKKADYYKQVIEEWKQFVWEISIDDKIYYWWYESIKDKNWNVIGLEFVWNPVELFKNEINNKIMTNVLLLNIILSLVSAVLLNFLLKKAFSPTKDIEKLLESILKWDLTQEEIDDSLKNKKFSNEFKWIIEQIRELAIKAQAERSLKESEVSRKRETEEFTRKIEELMKGLENSIGKQLLVLKSIIEELSKNTKASWEDSSLLTKLSESLWSIISVTNSSFNNFSQTLVKVISSLDNMWNKTKENLLLANDWNDKVNEVYKTIEALRSWLEETKRMLSWIKSIANQTNILSLNATIEATRAWKAWRWFGVVAAEIKVLARDSGILANNVESDIERVIETCIKLIWEFSVLITNMKEISSWSWKVESEVEKNKDSLNELIKLVEELGKLINNLEWEWQEIKKLSNSANEQSISSGGIMNRLWEVVDGMEEGVKLILSTWKNS